MGGPEVHNTTRSIDAYKSWMDQKEFKKNHANWNKQTKENKPKKSTRTGVLARAHTNTHTHTRIHLHKTTITT